jgi:hypothetical protein
MKKILVLVCVLFFAFQVNAIAKDKGAEGVKSIKIYAPGGHSDEPMEVTVPEDLSEDDATATNKTKEGELDDLTLVVKQKGDKKEFKIKKIPDGTIIETKGSDCRWYFIGNQWFLKCKQ